MTDDNDTDETDEQLEEYYDREDVTVLFGGTGHWEAVAGDGEIVDSGEVGE